MNPAHIAWTKNLLDLLKVGGTWDIPATGATVEKISASSVRIVNYGKDRRELDLVRKHINAAGYLIYDQESN